MWNYFLDCNNANLKSKGKSTMELVELLEMFISADEDTKNRVFEILTGSQPQPESQELPSDIML